MVRSVGMLVSAISITVANHPILMDGILLRTGLEVASSRAARGDHQESPFPPGRIVGVVRDAVRSEPIHGAVISLESLGRRVQTNEEGIFSLSDLPPGTHRLTVSATGYRALNLDVNVAERRTARLELQLELAPLPLAGLLVERRHAPMAGRIEAPEARAVDPTLLDLVPVSVERDVFRGVQTFPSVTPSSDFSTAPFVRGGAPDQTRIFLEGIPLHNPYHAGGFVAAFDPDATAEASLRPGGLPASASGGLSGLLELRVRDGGRDSLRLQGGLGLLSSSITFDGPIPGDRGAFLISGRRTYLDLATKAAERVGFIDKAIPYGFSDLLGKLTVDLGARGSLTAIGYLDREGLTDPALITDDDVDGWWGSDAFGLRGRWLPRDHLQFETGVSTSGFGGDFRRDPPGLDAQNPMSAPRGSQDGSTLDARVRTVAGDAALQAQTGPHTLFVGVRWERTKVDYDFMVDEVVDDFVPQLNLHDTYGTTAMYARDRWSLGQRFRLDAGLRLERLLGRGWFVLPRGRLEVDLGRDSRLAFSSGRYVQPWSSLRNEESAVSSIVAYDLLVPVPDERNPSMGWDVVAEFQTRFGGWTAQIDGFLKRTDDLPTAPVSLDPLDEPVFLAVDSVRVGKAEVRGFELFATGAFLGNALALSYRWQDEVRRLDSLTFTPRNNRRHRLSLIGSRAWGEREIAFALTWMTGQPFTPAKSVLPRVTRVGTDGRPTGGEGRAIVHGPGNSSRMPSYLRLDVDLRGAWDVNLFGHRGELEPYLSVLNILNRRNAFVAEQTASGGRAFVELTPQIPVLPTLGLRWRF